MWLVDLHCHTANRSPDSTALLSTLQSDAVDSGIQALCLTDHDAFWSECDLVPVSSPGMTLIRGAEINTDDGHVLVFGPLEYRFGFHHARTLAEAVANAGGAMVLAHPYRRALPAGVLPDTAGYDAALARALDNPLLRLVDAVEVVNGRGTETENRFAQDLARYAGLPGVAGSDAHRPGEAGRTATAFEFPVRSSADLIFAIKSGRFSVAGAPSSAPAGQPGDQ